jgi:hypothetical protein
MLTRFRPGMTAFLEVVMTLALTALTAAAQLGKQDYEAYCAECRGSGGKGNGPLSPGHSYEPAAARPHSSSEEKRREISVR